MVLLVVAGLVLLAALLVVPLALRRVCRSAVRHRPAAVRAVAVLLPLWLALSLLGIRAGTVPVASDAAASYALAQVTRVPSQLRDQREFARAAADDPARDTPAADLLTGLRGKDVLVVFVESYGRVALDDPGLSSGVVATLDDGTRRLGRAGYRARSAWLTSPTFGAISWLAHSTLQSGLWVDSQQRYDHLVTTDRETLSSLFGRAGWRTVASVPANDRDWPQGAFYGFDHVYDSRNVGYRGPRFGYPTMPDQFTLEAFQQAELAPRDRRPVMAEIDLISSHAPWSRTPDLLPQESVGDGSVYDGMPETLPSEADIWPDAGRVRAAYAHSIEYSLQSVVSFLSTYADDDLVVVLLGDHQPATIVSGGSGGDPGHDVPVTVIAKDPAVARGPRRRGAGTPGCGPRTTPRCGGWTPSATSSSAPTAPRATLGRHGRSRVEPSGRRRRPPEEEGGMPKDEVALMQRVHDEHAEVLWRFCLRLVGNDRGRAEDVTQETLLRAWRHGTILHSPPAAVRSWLFTVARNIVIDDWRSRKARPETPVERGPRAAPLDRGRRRRPAPPVVGRRRGAHPPVRGPPHRAAGVLLPRPSGRRGRPPPRRPARHREVAHPLRAAGAQARARGDGGLRMSTPTSCPHAHDDAAYVLGALSPAERLDFERHLDTCDECSRSVRSFAGMPGLLDLVDPGVLEDPPADPPLPATLLPSLTRAVEVRSRRRVARRRRARGRSGGRGRRSPCLRSSSAPTRRSPDRAPARPRRSRRDRPTAATRSRRTTMAPLGDVPVEASLGLEQVAWGTRMLLTCTYDKDAVEVELPEQVDYLLFVTASDGRSEQVGSWTSLSGATMEVPAATSVPRDDIASVEVRTTSGRVVLRLDA